uniref:SLX4 interacting protein n=1 Tax=Chelonoidis abingdonii TaxID=106734 RepID=A0A8C0ILI8_CHEAB
QRSKNRDSSWFSDHEKEELCLLLKDTIDSRVKHYLEARKHCGQWKHAECTQSSPLSLKGGNFHITAYFIKRWVNLRCVVGKQYRGNVKRTETRNSNMSKLQTSKDTMQVYLGSGDLETGSRKKEHQAPSDPQSEVKCRSIGQPKDCINTAESNSEFPALELENHVNQRQPDDASSQQKLHSAEWLKMRLLSSNPPCSCESALPDAKESQRVTKTQNQQKSCGSEEELDHWKKVSSEQGHLIPKVVERKKSNSGCIEPSSEEKSLLNPKLFSKQDLAKVMSDEESLTLGKIPPRPVFIKNNIPVIQTNQNEPATTTEELSLMPLSSYLKFNFDGIKVSIQIF